jgi:hypothetical protein
MWTTLQASTCAMGIPSMLFRGAGRPALHCLGPTPFSRPYASRWQASRRWLAREQPALLLAAVAPRDELGVADNMHLVPHMRSLQPSSLALRSMSQKCQ